VPSLEAVLAGAFEAAVRREGFRPDPGLRLLADRDVAVHGGHHVGDPHELGPLHERLVAGDERVRRGAWYTPRWLAEDLVSRAVGERGTVVDPSCGGGVFLLAAADHLVAGGVEPADALDRLWGCDIDPLAVAVSEAALWWWSARAGCPRRLGDRVVVGDGLAGLGLPRAGAVVGNPPFLGQLRSWTTMSDERRADLQACFGEVMRPYTDEAWLFLLRATMCLEPGGRAALIQPQSLLGARDAGGVRAAVDELADVVDLWVEGDATFDGAVPVCAPVLRRRPAGTPPRARGASGWTDALADARGVPRVELAGRPRLGELASVHAGFRDEYYGLVGAVAEGGPGVRLVTVGAIDPCRVLADRAVRFADQRWDDPRVDVSSLTGRARRWSEVQAGPKLLVATQTRVLEAVADADGVLLGSVPALAVRPQDPGKLWHLLAALHAPVVSAWLVRRTIGTARSADACRPTAAALSEVPLPPDGRAWDLAADVARRCSQGRATLGELGAAGDAAYGVDDPALRTWWSARLPRR
jgi:hypothetical protein